ncbi:hypothetical protein BOSEA31B_10018 [Hyphomicrobiales bacterium]|nr:hypothetical protein BOSEA31B_10018 [Hyphomicrobiales bacterium]CAH1701697.1 hypothetical protein BOSEA1005_21396 [Hyphomicrobiales bacterium]CAI0345854.1 hypothetical protein BO1005MUT1_470012 [Hyphomicrobiales bacterium]
MRVPKLLGGLSPFDELRGAQCDVAAGQRPVAEDIAQALAELVSDRGDALVGGTAIGAGIAAVFDERDLGAAGAENMIDLIIDRSVQAIGNRSLRHSCDPVFDDAGAERLASTARRFQLIVAAAIHMRDWETASTFLLTGLGGVLTHVAFSHYRYATAPQREKKLDKALSWERAIGRRLSTGQLVFNHACFHGHSLGHGRR